ncbi:putative ATPase/DNA-binding SARP family transcriptional activator [Leifsonia sp. AK011]|uniref:AfsR/SARP family transcriptional regulator n=1 Tax=Leifsonia sp. AK011 TaxID=2723075 RepID=UPI0015CE656E|nr:AAA family ATPase [Leifsonia sp. AK011]NYF10952.1 putative ATPase/DNA-binding SARP family transcriptional activator [Leifsonia sp. AK011]
MKVGLLGGLRVEHEGRSVAVNGTMQVAVLFRLAIDAGSAVSYRSIAEDIWAGDAPENTRGALQSIVSRLRTQLPPDVIESTPGGYRIALARADVDALAFSDLVAEAAAATGDAATVLATRALGLWRGEPWIPSDNFDWFVRDLLKDRSDALALGGIARVEASGSSIPAPLTALVGREIELETVSLQLGQSRLVTIIGTGGAGKTRLAVEAARSRPGAVLVELAPVGPTELYAAVLAATGREIRTSETSSEIVDTRTRVIEGLTGREVLVVLDNCEHVIDRAAALAADLLGALPQLCIIATSREPLGVPGEAFVAVGSLARDRAIELFTQRAISATAGEFSEGDLEVAGRICERLDGLPLAIELAAARLRTMSLDEVLSGLDDRFALLTGGFRTAMPRHQTLRAMIDWSWSLLSEEEQHVLAGFAVYPAGADAADAALLARSMGVASAGVFDSLVDRSLLQRNKGRYRQLETIREYGIERLAEAGLLALARERQVHVMVESAARHDARLRGPEIHDAIAWFDAEEDNIAGALRFATESRMAEEAVALAVSCFWYWTIRDREADSRTWMAAVGPLAATVDTDAGRLMHHVYPVVVAFNAGSETDADEEDVAQAMALLPRFEVSSSAPDVVQLVIPIIGAFSKEAGSPGWMTRVVVPRGEDLGLSEWPTAVLTVVRASIAQNRGDVQSLGEASQVAVDQFTAIGDWWGLALAQQMRSEWLSVNGRLEEALELSDASTENMRRITSSWDLAQQRSLSISILTRLGRVEEARQRAEELLAEADAGGNIRTITQALTTAIAANVSFGEADAARRYLERFDALAPTLSRLPGQLLALAESGRAGVALLDGDLVAAESALRSAAEHALHSGDHPVIGSVALDFGMLALARGDTSEAARALELAVAVLGAEDPTDPRVIAIEAAAGRSETRRVGLSPTRPGALEELRGLVS